MTNKIIKYATAIFVDGTAMADTLEWHTGTPTQAMERVKNNTGKPICALFHYQDIKDDTAQTFFPTEMEATREQFESDPALYGVCYYKQPFAGGTYVFE